MKSGRFQRERELFERCLSQGPEAWSRLLDESGEDADVIAVVRRMLGRHSDTAAEGSGFLRLDAGDPERIGPYRILQKLGEGGMGIVYSAEQREPVRRRVAVKVLRQGHGSREVLARFDVERQALALMNHPNIAHIVDAGTTADHRPYIVMEFVPGEPITQYAARKNLNVEQRLKLFQQVCSGMHHAHQKGVIHRDLKPSNILVMEESAQPIPKIIDFGIAKAFSQRLTDRTLETKVGSILGTPDYMSPEQMELSPLDVDTRADVYALGAVLYELLCGTPPFSFNRSGSTFSEMQATIREVEPEAPSARSGSAGRRLRGELDWVVLRALQKDRNHRYGSAAEFGDDVQRWLENEPTLAGPPSRLRHLRKFVQRHTGAVALAAVAGVVVSGLAIGMTLQARSLADERNRANLQAQQAEQAVGLLLEIFRGSDPALWRENPPAITDVLDKGANVIAASTDTPPLVRARLLSEIGNILEKVGDPARAAELLETARDDLLASASPPSILDVKLLTSLGIAYSYLDRREDAIAALDEAKALGEQLQLADSPVYLNALTHRALARLQTNEIELAVRELESLLPHAESVHGKSSREVLALRTNIGVARKRMGDHEGARKEFEALLPLALEHVGRMNSLTSGILMNLGNTAMRQERWADAERYHRENVAVTRQLYGIDSATTQDAMVSLAISTKDIGEAIELMDEVIAKRREQFGADSMRYLVTRINLAWILLKEPAQHERAYRIYHEVFPVFRKKLGDDHRYTQATALDYAKLLGWRGASEEAAELVEIAIGDPETLRMLQESPELADLRGLPAVQAVLAAPESQP